MKTKNIIKVWFLLAYVIIFETTTKIYQFIVENKLRIKFQKKKSNYSCKITNYKKTLIIRLDSF